MGAGPAQKLWCRVFDIRFRFSARRRAAALSDLAACSEGSDYCRFARIHLPFAPGSGSNQKDGEILAMLAFVAEREPRTVVEIGTLAGGTNFLLGTLLPSVTNMVGIDLLVRNRARLRAFARPGLDLQFVNGNSSQPRTREALEAVLGSRAIDLLFIDGDHSFRGALSDFRLYRTFVAPGGLVAFHDIVPDNVLRSGTPSSAWAGEVPLLWESLRGQYEVHEFVESWSQEGFGIGVLEYDPAIRPQFMPPRTISADR
jgi:predicted O-methyltransferase YrrM